MTDLPRALALSLGQLGDPPIRKILTKSVAMTLAIFALLGAALLYALYTYLASQGVAASGELSSLAAVVLTVIAGWLLFRFVALVVIQFFADEVVRAVERRHYPDAAAMPGAPLSAEIRASAKGLVRALVVNAIALPFALILLVTGVGTALLFWVVNAVLLGRELTEMVWLRHRTTGQAPVPVGAGTRFALGGIVAALLAIPVINLLAPVLGAAAATHLVHGRKGRA